MKIKILNEFILGFNPGLASTPRTLSPGSPVQESTSVLFSAKHNGLYLYVSRILRPLWSESIVAKVVTPTKQQFVRFSHEIFTPFYPYSKYFLLKKIFS